MASAEMLKITHCVDDRVIGVDDRVKGVERKVQDVYDDVQDVRNDVQEVEHRVQSIGKSISSDVQVVDHKLDRVNRSLSRQSLLIPNTHTSSQETSSERIFYDGFHPQIHPPTIILHATLITMAHLNGFFKEIYSMNGNLLVLSCGYTESVRYSRFLSSVNS